MEKQPIWLKPAIVENKSPIVLSFLFLKQKPKNMKSVSSSITPLLMKNVFNLLSLLAMLDLQITRKKKSWPLKLKIFPD